MKKNLAVIGAVFAVLATLPAPVHAEAFTVRASVPFAFSAGGRELPAGDYVITPLAGSSGVLLIEGVGGKTMVMTQSADTRISAAALDFASEGSEQVLTAVKVQGRRFELHRRPASASIAISLRNK